MYVLYNHSYTPPPLHTLPSTLSTHQIGFFDTVSTGEITSRLTADTAEMANDLTWVFRFCIEAIVRIGGIVGYMYVRSWKLALAACAVIPVIAVFNKMYGDWLQKNQKNVQAALAKANAKAQEVVSCLRTVRSFASEAHEQAHYNRLVQENYRLSMKQTFIQAVYYMVIATFLVNACVQAGLLLYGCYLVRVENLDYTVVLAFMLYQGQLQEYFQNLLNSYTNLVKSVGAGTKVFEYLDRRPRRRRLPSERGRVIEDLRGHIQFIDVEFAYPSRPQAPVLRGVSFEVKPGEVVALVGSSGSGKSTCFHLLEQFYEASRGRVLLDGVDLPEIDHTWLHGRAVGIVGQEPVLFEGTILDNIMYSTFSAAREDQLGARGVAPGPVLDDSGDIGDDSDSDGVLAVVIAAAKVANAHDFVCALPEGYSTQVGERGVQLSGGQKQRIAIARTVLQDPAIMLLDEATSALDTESESLVQEALDRAMGSRTVLVIAHRLSTVARSDRIVVLDQGRIVETGTHGELMQRPIEPGVTSYRHLVQKQLTLGGAVGVNVGGGENGVERKDGGEAGQGGATMGARGGAAVGV